MTDFTIGVIAGAILCIVVLCLVEFIRYFLYRMLNKSAWIKTATDGWKNTTTIKHIRVYRHTYGWAVFAETDDDFLIISKFYASITEANDMCTQILNEIRSSGKEGAIINKIDY